MVSSDVSRRAIFRFAATGSAICVTRLRGSSYLDRVAAAYPAKPLSTRAQHYRADAAVTVLGVTIFSRSNVGSANLTVVDGVTGDGARTVELRFAAGSLPERTSGLNRLGFIQEIVVERNGGILESAWFGFMTSSPEKNLEEAKKALSSEEKNTLPCVASEGSARNGQSGYQLYHLALPGNFSFARYEEAIRHVREELAGKQLKPVKAESTSGLSSPRTFLYAVREAMRSSSTQMELPFLHNGNRFTLAAIKEPDPKMGDQFASRKVTESASQVQRLNGSLRNVRTGDRTPFRLWFETGNDLPLRFEYRPKGYLNLSFERNRA